MSVYLKWGALALWAGALSVGMLLYSQQQLTLFDPDQRLLQAAARPDFDQQVVATLEASGIAAGSVVHFQRKDSCFCNTLTEPHQTQLASTLSEQGYQLSVVDIDSAPALASLIPSTPAVAVVSQTGELRYLGPYATGYGCFTGKTLVDTIARYASLTLPGAVINADAEGCFCHA
ncbi:DUF6436 domain-containing protein [Alteromonas sp. CYL-A6]|uniref:DUF6436 domain-containing protein n=1 Tax=Alteromonas nitratireducens TaxID=3390813 RepID=UPI0034B9C5CD